MASKNTESKKAIPAKGDKQVTSPRKGASPQDERKKGEGDPPKKNDEKRVKKAQPKKDVDKTKADSDGNFEEAPTEHHLKEKILSLKRKLQEIQSELSEASEEKDDSLLSALGAFIDVSPYLPGGTSPEPAPEKDKEKEKEKEKMPLTSTHSVSSLSKKEAPKEIRVSSTFAPYPHPVFGVPLKTLVVPSSLFFTKTGRSQTQIRSIIFGEHAFIIYSPPLLSPLKAHIRFHVSSKTKGVWRVPGEAEEMQYYKKCFDEGKEITFKCSHFDVAGLFKQWIRELPEPLIPPLFDAQVPFLLDAHKGEEDSTGLLNDLKDLVQSLPKPNFAVVCLLGGLLAELAKHSEINKMTEDNIIRCILPTVGCVPALFLWMIRCPEIIFGGTLARED